MVSLTSCKFLQYFRDSGAHNQGWLSFGLAPTTPVKTNLQCFWLAGQDSASRNNLVYECTMTQIYRSYALMGSWWKILPVSDKRADSDPGMALAGTARSTLSICISLWTTPKRKWNVTWIWNEWSRVSMYCIWPAMIGIWLILTIFILILLLQMETRVKWLVPQGFKPTTLYQVGYSIHLAKRFEFSISC